FFFQAEDGIRVFHVTGVVCSSDLPAQPLTDSQTFWQPYARFIPAEGQIVVLFGNWYSDLLSTAMHVTVPMNESMFDDYVERMRAFEQDLKNNHVDVVKVWFDLSWKSLQKRLDDIDPSEMRWHRLHGVDWRSRKQYDAIQRLRQRFTDDWIIIDGEDETRRDQQFAQTVLAALQHCPEHPSQGSKKWQQASIPEILQRHPQQEVDKNTYKDELKKLSSRVASAMRMDRRNVVIVFEGMDAAGKGGVIKRIVKKLDP